MLKVSNPDEAGNSLFVWGIPQSSLDVVVVVVVVVVITIAYVYESDVCCRPRMVLVSERQAGETD
jgi:hypothetical protein